jgi:hypothetical protein
MTIEAVREAMAWYYFIPRVSPSGSHWFAALRSSGSFEIFVDLERVVALARSRRVGESRSLLRQTMLLVKARRRSVPPTVWLVLARLYLAVHANLRYVQGEYGHAERLLRQASEAEYRAIAEAGFLTTLAASRCEFCLHYARIARNRCQWREMTDWLRIGRSMMRSERELLRLSDGRPIFMSDIDAVYRAIEPRNDTEKEALRRLTDAVGREGEYEGVARQVEALGTVVIPFDSAAAGSRSVV